MSAPFRLARLLALRKRLEDQRRLELARELGERSLREQALEQARVHLEEARQQLAQELEQGIVANRWCLLSGYLERQESSLGHRRRAITDLEPRLRLAREKLGQALKERRVLDRLQEHWREERDTQEKRLEQGRLDETGGRQWWRRQRTRREDEHGSPR